MQRGEKAPEPSMEEILASIRKIIAEEPIGSRPGPAPAGDERPPDSSRDPFAALGIPSRAAAAASQPFPAPSQPGKAARGPDSTPLPTPPEPASGAPPPAAAGGAKTSAEAKPAETENRQRPSWLFAKPTGIPPPPASEPGGAPARLIQPTPLPFEVDGRRTTLDTPQHGETPFASSPPPKPSAPGAMAATGLGTQRSNQISDEAAEVGDAEEPANEAGSRGAASVSQREPDIAAPSPSSPASAPEDQDDAGPAFEARTTSKPQHHAAVAPGAMSAYSALAKGLAASGAAAKPAVSESAVPVSSQERVAPTPSPARAAGPVAPEASTKEEVAQSPTATRTLEDTVADLLRPMLRDWLDANMPRIVEKALRVELAKTIKPPAGGSSSL